MCLAVPSMLTPKFLILCVNIIIHKDHIHVRTSHNHEFSTFSFGQNRKQKCCVRIQKFGHFVWFVSHLLLTKRDFFFLLKRNKKIWTIDEEVKWNWCYVIYLIRTAPFTNLRQKLTELTNEVDHLIIGDPRSTWRLSWSNSIRHFLVRFLIGP